MFADYTERGPLDRFCLSDGHKLDVGYIANRSVLIMTGSPRYEIRGIRAGMDLRRTDRLREASRARAGGFDWYFVRGGRSVAVVKAVTRRVRAVGIAARSQAATREQRRRLLARFARRL